MKYLENLSKMFLVLSISASALVAQNARVEVSKHPAIPKVCESVAAANLAGALDVDALVKEATCKGAGDMLAEYTYVTHSVRRQVDKKGNVKEETFTFEVFFPTLKSGMKTKGIMVVTSHNGVPVSPADLEKARTHAAEQTEKEEAKNGRQEAAPEVSASTTAWLRPLGSYTRTTLNHETLTKKSRATLSIPTFLKKCDLAFARREQVSGRETLIFNFRPRPEAQFQDEEKYIAQLTGEIWIDAQDRIVIRLVGWPIDPAATATPLPGSGSGAGRVAAVPLGVRPPAVQFELLRLNAGIWLPSLTRINAVDYPTLFENGITADSLSIYSDYIRFSTEVKDVKTTPNTP